MDYSKYQLDDGSVVYIETVDLQLADDTGSGSLAMDIGQAEERIQDFAVVSETMTGVTRSVFGDVKAKLGDAMPDEITLEFAVNLSGGIGVPLVTSAEAGASFKFTVKWKS